MKGRPWQNLAIAENIITAMVYINLDKDPELEVSFYDHRNHTNHINTRYLQLQHSIQFSKSYLPIHTITMESARQAMKYVSESVQGHASGASKGVNKEIAKDPNVRLSSR